MKNNKLILITSLFTTTMIFHESAAAQYRYRSLPRPVQTQPNAALGTTAGVGRYPGWKMNFGHQRQIKINGFLSAGAATTDTAIPYVIPGHGSITNTWTYAANSLAGLQFSAYLNNSFSGVIQLVANGDNNNGNQRYVPTVQWAFIRYVPFHQLQLRAGRFRMPLFLYSDTQEVGYSYPQVFLPNEVYRIVPFDDMNGFDLIWNEPLGDTGWNILLHPFLGANTSQYDIYPQNNPDYPLAYVTADFAENSMVGMEGTLGNQYLSLRGAYTHVKLSGSYPDPTNSAINIPLFTNADTNFYSIGARLDYKYLLLIAEYADRGTPNQIAALQGYYGTIGLHLGKFLPNFTFGHIRTTNTSQLNAARAAGETAEFPQAQYSYNIGLNYYFNNHVDAKIAYQRIHPLDNTQGLFVINPGKANINLYTISFDAVF